MHREWPSVIPDLGTLPYWELADIAKLRSSHLISFALTVLSPLFSASSFETKPTKYPTSNVSCNARPLTGSSVCQRAIIDFSIFFSSAFMDFWFAHSQEFRINLRRHQPIFSTISYDVCLFALQFYKTHLEINKLNYFTSECGTFLPLYA